MKWFLIITLGFLVVALAAAVLVFSYIQSNVVAPTDNQSVATSSFSTSSTSEASPEEGESHQEESVDATTDTKTAVIEETAAVEGIPLRDLPLSESQRQAAETVGIDVESFVITKAMIDCVAEKLGEERYEEILGGASPTFFESIQLTTCLGS